jgi:hypothetical protein
VRFSEVKVSSEADGFNVLKKAEAGKTLEQIAEEDSIRMAQPLTFYAVFGKNSSKVTPPITKTLARIAAELKTDPIMRVHLTARVDTSTHAEQNRRLATKRQDALKTQLSTKLGLNAQRVITTLVQESGGSTRRPDTLDLQIVGRRPLIIGKIAQSIAAAGNDERSRHADSLAVGDLSKPFAFQSSYVIVRLDGREAARQKTFEEAGPEVSTAFQDAESKRLENEWLGSLRNQFPVVENKQALREAFASPK